MLWKIEEPFNIVEIESATGKATNTESIFQKYTINENGKYLLVSFYSADTLIEIYKKNASNINLYTTSATLDFHAIENQSFTEDKWQELSRLAYAVDITNTFAVLDNTNFDTCLAIYADRKAKRQFMVLNITNIEGEIAINQVFQAGYNVASIPKV